MGDAVGESVLGPTVGQLLQRARQRAHLTQAELGERTGYSTNYISKLERDQRRPPTVALDRIADVLDLDDGERAALRTARRLTGVAASSLPSQPSRRPAPLPASPSPLIGRMEERAAVRDALTASRLVTLTGTGGTGKTRLALQVAHDLVGEGRFADGVAFVDLAPLADPSLLASTIARALDLADRPGMTAEAQLAAELRLRHLLLVLDNLEHLLDGVAPLSRLLAAAPHLHILATSRSPLHLYGEQEIRVPPLPLPTMPTTDGRGDSAAEDLTASDAVRLFLARARAVRPGITPAGTELEAIARICIALDGLPLAIELAAARANLFTPDTLLARLDECLSLLTRGPRDSPDRQRTLRAALDWSYDLLASEEQVLFSRLGIFPGSFDVAAATGVAGSEDGVASFSRSGEAAMLDRLEALADHSLLEVVSAPSGSSPPSPAPRFRLLETVRAYALDRLAASGQEDTTRRRHLSYYLALAEEMHAALGGPAQSSCLARLEAEHANLRAALGWALRHAPEDGLRLAGELGRFWRLHGHLREGQHWLETALDAHVGVGDRRVRARVLSSAGALARQQGDYGRALARHSESLELRRALGDKRGVADSLTSLGNVYSRRGDAARAAALHSEALDLFREVGNQSGVSTALGNLGRVTLQLGDDERASQLLTETLQLKRRLGDGLGTAFVLTSLARVAIRRGEYGRASNLLDEGLAIKRSLGDRHGQVTSLLLLGRVALLQQETARAEAVLTAGLRLGWEIGARDRMSEILESLACVVAIDGRAEAAALLAGAADALREELTVAISPDLQAGHEEMLRTVRATLGEGSFSAAWSMGKGQSLETTVTEVLGVTEAWPALDDIDETLPGSVVEGMV
ncbi:MAG TPA: tetratricopeptide repeat protein [Chloroflexota bacterium]|nr:tetratricopeptide repeat protein [Chloroflexota bacterium]